MKQTDSLKDPCKYSVRRIKRTVKKNLCLSQAILLAILLLHGMLGTNNKNSSLVVESAKCFTPIPLNPFPQILGGVQGDSQYSCIAYDSYTGKVLVGGMSKSTQDFVSQSQIPFLVQYDAITGAIDWHTQVTTTTSMADFFPQNFTKCVYQDGGSTKPYIVAMSTSPEYGIFIFSKSNGQLVTAFYEHDYMDFEPMLTRNPVGIYMTSLGTIQLVSLQGQALMVSQFDFTGPDFSILSPTYSVTYASGTKLFTAALGLNLPVTSTDDSFYMFGSINNKVTTFKFKASDGSFRWAYSLKDMANVSNTVKLARQDVRPGLGGNNIFGCAEDLGSNALAFAFVYMTETFGMTPSISQTWFINSSVKVKCLAVAISGTSIGQFLIFQEFSSVFYGSVTFGSISTSLTFTKVAFAPSGTSALHANKAIFKGSSVYFVGSLTGINAQSYQYKMAFLHQYPSASCLPATTSFSVTAQVNTLFILGLLTAPPLYNPGTDSLTDSNTYIEYIVAWGLKNTSLLNITSQIQMPSECLTTPTQGTISYGSTIISSPQNYSIVSPVSPPLSLTFSNFTYSLTCDDISWKYTATMADGTILPSYLIQFQETSSGGSFTISSSDSSSAGQYDITIKGTVGGMYSSSYNFSIVASVPPSTPPPASPPSTTPPSTPPPSTPPTTPPPPTTTPPTTPSTPASPSPSPSPTPTPIPTPPTPTPVPIPPSSPSETFLNSAPYFVSEPDPYLSLYSDEQLSYELPAAFDPNPGDQINVNIAQMTNNAPLPAFIKLVEGDSTLQIKPKSTNVGRYFLIVNLTDGNIQNPLSTQYLIIVDVFQRVYHQKPQIDLPNDTEHSNNTTNIPKSNNTQNESDVVKYTRGGFGTRDELKMMIRSVSNTGEVVVLFSQEVLVPLDFSDFSQGKQLQLSINGNPLSTQIQSWHITDFTLYSFKIQLDWDDPASISSNTDENSDLPIVDTLSIKILDPQSFINLRTWQPINSKYSTSYSIPVQVRSSIEQQVLQSMSGIAQSLLTGAVIATITLNLFLTMFLQQLWGMINTLQLILHVPLFSIDLPANAQYFLQTLFNVVTFDFLDTNPKIQYLFQLRDPEEYPAFNDRFDFLGYSTTNSLYNIGLPVFFIMLYMGMLSFYLLTLLFPIKKLSPFKEWLQRKVYFGPPIRFVIEMALEGVLSSLVNIIPLAKGENTFEGWGDYLSLAFSIGLTASCMVVMGLSAYLLIKYRESFESEYIEKYYSELTDDTRNRNVAQVLYLSISMFRRFLYIGIIFVFEDTPQLQLLAFVLSNLAYLIYICRYRPLIEQSPFELFNEMCTLMISILLLLQTQFVADDDIQYYLGGYSFIGIICMNVLVNVLFMVKNAVIGLYKTLRIKLIWGIYKVKKCLKKLKSAKKDIEEEEEWDRSATIIQQRIDFGFGQEDLTRQWDGQEPSFVTVKMKKKKGSKGKKKKRVRKLPELLTMEVEPKEENEQNTSERLHGGDRTTDQLNFRHEGLMIGEDHSTEFTSYKFNHDMRTAMGTPDISTSSRKPIFKSILKKEQRDSGDRSSNRMDGLLLRPDNSENSRLNSPDIPSALNIESLKRKFAKMPSMKKQGRNSEASSPAALHLSPNTISITQQNASQNVPSFSLFLKQVQPSSNVSPNDTRSFQQESSMIDGFNAMFEMQNPLENYKIKRAREINTSLFENPLQRQGAISKSQIGQMLFQPGRQKADSIKHEYDQSTHDKAYLSIFRRKKFSPPQKHNPALQSSPEIIPQTTKNHQLDHGQIEIDDTPKFTKIDEPKMLQPFKRPMTFEESKFHHQQKTLGGHNINSRENTQRELDELDEIESRITSNLTQEQQQSKRH